MRAGLRAPLAIAGALAAAAWPSAAAADHSSRSDTKKLQAFGHSADPGTFELPDGRRDANSDLAFWGDHVFHGDYDGFRIIRTPETPESDPELVSRTRCNGDQGDLVVWKHILVRSWNTARSEDRNCDGRTVKAGFEGVHVFDISDSSDPQLVDEVELECGSHTVTLAGVTDAQLIVYSNNSSSSGCADGTRAKDDEAGDFMDVIGVPLEAPDRAKRLRREPLEGPATDVRTGCHDAGVIRGSVDKAACASADTINVWDVGGNGMPGGSLTDPKPLFTISEPDAGEAGSGGRWHSVSFTWDGEVLVAGWEPGGGGEAECEAIDPDVKKSLFFYDADTGAKLGQWVLPNPQGADENCTVHNLNIVPLEDRYVAVSGNYQAGTWVTEFTDPSKPVTLGWSDPPSLGPGSFCDGRCQIGGAWSSYWYNGLIYEGDITKGLNVFGYIGTELEGARQLPHLNPQTQHDSFG